MEDPSTAEEARQQGYKCHGVYKADVGILWSERLKDEGYSVLPSALNNKDQVVAKGTTAIWIKR